MSVYVSVVIPRTMVDRTAFPALRMSRSISVYLFHRCSNLVDEWVRGDNVVLWLQQQRRVGPSLAHDEGAGNEQLLDDTPQWARV